MYYLFFRLLVSEGKADILVDIGILQFQAI